MVMLRFRRSANNEARSELAAIQDGASCRTWLASLGPLEASGNLVRVAEFIGEVMEGPLPDARKYEVIDRLRIALHGLLKERVRDPETRPIPLTTTEAEPIWLLVDTVEDLREAYELLITRLDDRPRGPAPDPAGAPVATKVMALHRALDTNAHVIILYLRLRVAVPERLWDQHCRLGQLARQLEVHNEDVEDASHASLTETCREAFNLPVLVALADPGMLSPQEFAAAFACALRWAGKVGFRIDSAQALGCPPQRPATNPGPVIQLASNEHQVRLDTHRMLRSVERRMALLDEGNTPQSLGLGDAISPAASRALLAALLRRWGHVMPETLDSPDQQWRPSPSEFALAVAALGQSGESSRKPTSPALAGGATYEYVRQRDDALTRSQGEIEKARVERLLDEAETWSVVGETPDSVLCLRRHSRPRLGIGQLVGVKLGGKAGPIPFLVGWVQALQQGINDTSQGVARPASTHLVRVKLISGLPQAVRAAVDQVEVDPVYLLIPNAPVDAEAPIWDDVRRTPEAYSMVLPLATFRPARTMRVVAQGAAAAVRLDELVLRGTDFDHVRFKLV